MLCTLVYLNRRTPSLEEALKTFGTALVDKQGSRVWPLLSEHEKLAFSLDKGKVARIVDEGLSNMIGEATIVRFEFDHLSELQCTTRMTLKSDAGEYPVELLAEIQQGKPRVFLGLTAQRIWTSKAYSGDVPSMLRYYKEIVVGIDRDAELLSHLGLSGSISNAPGTKPSSWDKKRSHAMKKIAEFESANLK